MRSVLTVPVVTLLMAVLTAPADAQPASVQVPPLEFGVGVSFDGLARDDAGRRGRIGATLSVARNVSEQFALGAEVGTPVVRGGSGRLTSIVAGPRVSTGFYSDDGGRSVGRFFAELMAGTEIGGGALVIAGVGADALVAPRRGVALHWSIDYRRAPASRPDLAGGRVVLGLVFGPRIQHGDRASSG